MMMGKTEYTIEQLVTHLNDLAEERAFDIPLNEKISHLITVFRENLKHGANLQDLKAVCLVAFIESGLKKFVSREKFCSDACDHIEQDPIFKMLCDMQGDATHTTKKQPAEYTKRQPDEYTKKPTNQDDPVISEHKAKFSIGGGDE